MAKTCRTCGFSALARECNRRHIWVSDTELCGDHKPRETPLLVDELGQALQLLLGLHHGVHYVSKQWTGAIDAGMKAQARYKEEVGDDPR